MLWTGKADVALAHPQKSGGAAEQDAVGPRAERVDQARFPALPRRCVFRGAEQGAAVTTERDTVFAEDTVDGQAGGDKAGGGSIQQPFVDPCLSVGIRHGGEEIAPPLGGGDAGLPDRAKAEEGDGGGGEGESRQGDDGGQIRSVHSLFSSHLLIEVSSTTFCLSLVFLQRVLSS